MQCYIGTCGTARGKANDVWWTEEPTAHVGSLRKRLLYWQHNLGPSKGKKSISNPLMSLCKQSMSYYIMFKTRAAVF